MINLYNLKYFADAVRLNSMTKSAEQNHLSRSAISQAIQKLESELGVDLLVHKRRGFELTAAGTEVAKRAATLLEQSFALKSDLSPDQPLRGEFRIGSARTLASFALPKTIAKLKKDFPLVDFKVRLHNSQDLIDMLSRREIDAAFFLGEETLHGYKQIVVNRGRYILVRPKKLSAERCSYALTERRAETERALVLYERNFGAELPIFSQVNSWDSIWAWMNEGICGGLVPDFMMRLHPKEASQLTEVIPSVFPYEVKVVFHKTRRDDPLISTLLSALKAFKF